MQIKDVAKTTGLSVKTIRFYEERGLITPKVEYRNGRNYREYRESDIEQLNMVAVLRKCLFSIDQIKTMMDHPELTPDVFTEYRIALMTQRELLNHLAEKAETLDPETLEGPEVLARKLTTTASPLPLPHTDTSPHFGRFDPETPEERQAAFVKWQKKYKYRHIRRWLPVAVTVLVLMVMTGVRATERMNVNLEEFIYTKQMLEQDAIGYVRSLSDNDLHVESMVAEWLFYRDATYGLYTTDNSLLEQPESIPNGKEEDMSPEEVLGSVMNNRFRSTFMGDKPRLQNAMKKWVEKSPNLEFRSVEIRSNVFCQTMACAIPVEIKEKPYYLVIYFRQSPVVYALRDMAVWYLFAVFVWGLVFAFSASKGYGFRVHYLRAYGPRGTWNNAIIHIDEKTGEGTMLTQQYNGISSLMRSNNQEKK